MPAVKHSHITRDLLEGFLSDDNRSETATQILFHLLSVCPDCRRVGGTVLAAFEAGALPPDFSLIDVELYALRRDAPSLWKTLESLPEDEQRRRIQTEAPYLSWGLAELLCQKSAEAGSRDPARAVALASMAVEVAERLKEWQPCELEWLYELRGFAWAHLASAYRVSGDLRRAERTVKTSDTWWSKGVDSMGDSLGYEPVILSLKASLRKDQRRFEEAIELLDAVIGIYIAGEPTTQDFHMAGRTFLLKGKVLEEQGDLEQALSLLRESAPLIDPERDPRLALCLRHNLVDYLSKLGRCEEARSLLPQAQALAQELGNALDLVRLRWVEGRIAGVAGDAAEAERIFLSVRDEFAARGINFDTAVVSLELAALYAKENRQEEMKALARQAHLLLTAQDIPAEALPTFALFQRAASGNGASPELVQELASFLQSYPETPQPRT